MNRQRTWLRHYATSRKVAGSITDEVIGFLIVTAVKTSNLTWIFYSIYLILPAAP
jgi:hypothetical protein